MVERKGLILFLIITFITLVMLPTTHAWEWDFTDGSKEGWTYGGSGSCWRSLDVVVEDFHNYSYTRVLKFHEENHGWCSAGEVRWVKTPYIDGGFNYITFRYIRNPDYGTASFQFQLLDESGSVIASTSNKYAPELNDTNVEIVIINGYAYLFIGGEEKEVFGDGSVSGENVRYLRLYRNFIDYGCYDIYLDTFTTSGYHISVNEYGYDHNATEYDDNEMNVEWIVPLYYDKGATFKIIVRRLNTGAIVNETDVSEDANNGIFFPVTYNRTELLGYNYGLYIFGLTKDGQLMDYDYFYYMPPYETSYLAFDKETYASSETATINYDIASPDFSSHNYYIKILDMYGNEKKKWHITKESGSVTFNTNELDAGTYYAVLVQYSEPVDLAYDMMQIEERVDIEGVSYDAKSESVLGAVNVNASQGTVWHNATTDATTGYYNLTDFIVDEAIQMNASKTNYTHNNFSFTPLQSGLYEINLFLLPDASHINVTAPAIVGLTQLYPFHQNVSYATVNIWNDTWNASTTTNSMGYFAFENLTPGTYYLNATREKFKSSETYEVNLSSGEIEYVYILMHEIYNLTIRARDAGTHSTIFEFRAILNDGEQTKETTSGWLNFTVEYGIHKVEVGA
ncbi:hypothetical protein DRN52_08475, partial [Thermococci archaeon]